ncbi:MAG: acyl-CoA dehydrogenase [Rhodospirillum sp.]|nr:acyl-CoA dehydrogenase [Rhodospirillum sp.]MCF8489780.1 acyl-CoA dehydrogenase [Rhodospirillum sp.]
MTYKAPLSDILTTLDKALGYAALLDGSAFGGLEWDAVEGILDEAGKFAASVLAPTNRTGDLEGVTLKEGVVTLPQGFKEAYAQWAELGWNGVAAPEAFGGMGFSTAIALATFEIWDGANMALGTGPTLTLGAIDLLLDHASDALKDTYLPKLVSGAWMATMHLTEAQAGSDVGALRTRAVPQGDGTYRLFGEKIFITFGEHDLTENIIHLVLARLPDAPPGTKGISLFLVPKILVNDDGSLGARNDVHCVGVEHKLGIHASPTCTMLHGREDGAMGWLVGEENRGLACMFTMMNAARLWTAIQGVALGEASFQKARDYALERVQGRDPATGKQGTTIIHHPDVRRNLLTMKALVLASRAICLSCAATLDEAAQAEGKEKAALMARAGLLTPIAKAFSTDAGLQATSIGVQIHGGMGFVEETGAAQFLRDARIPPIYEGTNGIQAIDLVTRKIPQAGGAVVASVLDGFSRDLEGFGDTLPPSVLSATQAAVGDLRVATELMLTLGTEAPVDALGIATPYLRLFGLTMGGVLLAKGAAGTNDPGWRAVTRFLAEDMLPETSALLAGLRARGGAVAATTPDLFEAM